jgi:hypothetical protein
MKNIFKDKDQNTTGPLVSKTFKIDLDAKKIGKKASIAFLAITTAAGLSIGVLIGLNSFFSSHYFEFRSPVIFQAPILLQDRKTESTIEIVKEVEAKEEVVQPVKDVKTSFVHEGEIINDSVIAKADNRWILWKVYALESSRGKNDGCRDIGKFNGFGYRQNKNEHICFDTFEEVVGYVDAWFTKQLKTKTLEQALCWYNEGKDKASCEYSSKFLGL